MNRLQIAELRSVLLRVCRGHSAADFVEEIKQEGYGPIRFGRRLSFHDRNDALTVGGNIVNSGLLPIRQVHLIPDPRLLRLERIAPDRVSCRHQLIVSRAKEYFAVAGPDGIESAIR